MLRCHARLKPASERPELGGSPPRQSQILTAIVIGWIAGGALASWLPGEHGRKCGTDLIEAEADEDSG
jgi:hypothetical protein